MLGVGRFTKQVISEKIRNTYPLSFKEIIRSYTINISHELGGEGGQLAPDDIAQEVHKCR